jgi:hypothetical protein
VEYIRKDKREKGRREGKGEVRNEVARMLRGRQEEERW